MDPYSLYVIDDEESIRQSVRLALQPQYRVSAFATAEDGLAAMDGGGPDLVLLDIGLPGMNGLEALQTIRARFPEMAVVMITAYEDVQTVVQAMRHGAYDYAVKPLSGEGLLQTIRNALERVRLRRELFALQEQCLQEDIPCCLGESGGLQEVMALVAMVAKSPDTPVLVVGETGSGKELVARAVHYRSPNFQGPFVAVNCAAIPKELIESELFGYEAGAFSGARPSGKKGLIEEAHGGTLFLDEIGDLLPEAQAKLLRFLDSGEFFRIGAGKTTRVQARIVSATNHNLKEMVGRNQFRRDLYYRLGVVTIQVPSLNERREDILPLAMFFLKRFSVKFGKKVEDISAAARQFLLGHHFAGNVRELKNMIERGVLVSRGSLLESADISGPEASTPGISVASGKEWYPALTHAGLDLEGALHDMERHFIEEALRHAGGNESMAARLLRMNHHTFRYRRRKM